MFDKDSIARMSKATAYDRDGDKIGKVGQIYADNETGEPTFATVSTGLFGTSETFVPLTNAKLEGDDLHVAYTKEQVKDAPRVDDDGELSPAEEDRLYAHYQLAAPGAAHTGDDVKAPAAAGTATGGHDATQTVTAHEERLTAGTQTEETGRVRLRKYTTTEKETIEVPVSKEKLVVERENVSGEARPGGLDANATGDSTVEEEIVLREERAVVGKETVENERVRVGKETVTDTERVTEEVRKEHIDVDGDKR